MTDELRDAYEARFRAAADAGSASIYEPLDALHQAAHERRMALLDALPIGDLAGRVVVDHGVGSWGFAAVYPRLHSCGRAIGIDVSPSAVHESARVSREGTFAYGDRVEYRTAPSSGAELPLGDGEVDLLFSGESIEHVEHVDGFVDEVHRSLAPGGLFVITTPNADAHLYRARGERWCVGPEHVSLMSFDELRAILDGRFDVVVAQGYQATVHSSVDASVSDPAFAAAWAATLEDRPDLASGLVVLARRRDDYRAPRHVLRRFGHADPAFRWSGPWRTMPLHESLTARLADPGVGARCALRFDGTDLQILFWAHDWSGGCDVVVDGERRAIDLRAPRGGFRPVHVGGLEPGSHDLEVIGTGPTDPDGPADQVLIHAVTASHRTDHRIVR